MNFTYLAGILPAIIFPAATLLQIVRIVRHRSTVGVSKTTWLLFGLANIALYVYTERYGEWQAIAGLLLTAVLDFVIVALAIFAYRAAAAKPN
ncbi:MAG: hypothetical protein PSV13_12810 [Lacunisphaera sp.]|nr:hypothetical protein [Lacunisphaera sp.]